MVPPPRRPDKVRPPLAVTQRRPDHLLPRPRVRIAKLIQDNAIEVAAPHPVVIVKPVKPYPGPGRQINPQLSLMHRAPHYRLGVPQQITPGDVLSLRVSRRRIRQPRVGPRALQSLAYQLVDLSNRLPAPAVRNRDAPTLGRVVQRQKLPPRQIGDRDRPGSTGGSGASCCWSSGIISCSRPRLTIFPLDKFPGPCP